MGLDESACAWFQSYLTDRRQRVQLRHTKSDFLSVSGGVPQGSVWGPLIFTVYINYIIHPSNGCHTHFYVDDPILYCIADSVQTVINNLQSAFNSFQESLLTVNRN